jgi:hypothetical protein
MKAEAMLDGFRQQVLNPTGTNPVLAHHVTELIKQNQAQGMDVNKATKVAVNQAFRENHEDMANVIYQAHSSGTIAHTLQTFPQLSQEFPVISAKYGTASQPTPAPAQPNSPQANPTPIKPISIGAPPQVPTQMASVPDQGLPGISNPESQLTPDNEPMPEGAEDETAV